MEIYHNTKFQDLTLHGDSTTSFTQEIHIATIMVRLIDSMEFKTSKGKLSPVALHSYQISWKCAKWLFKSY